MGEKLVIGTQTIENAFKEKPNTDEKRIEILRKAIAKKTPKKEEDKNIQQNIVNELKKELTNQIYKPLNLEFLARPIQTKVNNVDTQLPRFAIYKVFSETQNYQILIQTYYAGIEVNFEELPRIFLLQIGKSLEIYYDKKEMKFKYSFSNDLKFYVKNKTYKKYKKIGPQTYQTKFEGLLSDKDEKELFEIAKSTPKEQLYLIGETTPEQWRGEESQIINPHILVSANNQECFYIKSLDILTKEEYLKTIK